MNAAAIAAWTAIVIQVAALVWGAARLSAAVGRLTKTADHFEQTLGKLADRVSGMGAQVAVNEQRLKASEARLRTLEDFVFRQNRRENHDP